MSQPVLLPGENQFQAITSASKLRGQYYTPDALVAMMFDALPVTRDHVIVDPSCGDGSFLRGAVAAIARKFSGEAPSGIAEYWAQRIIGFDVNPDAVTQARGEVQTAFRTHFGTDVSSDILRIYEVDPLRSPDLSQTLRSVGDPGLGDADRLLVVGNPPYVEAKRLSRESKAILKAQQPLAVAGAPDLYLYFLDACLGWLKDEDDLAFVLPNKLLVNANAQSLRERLLREGRLRRLWFATQAGVFASASVYPVILFASGIQRPTDGSVEVVRITGVNGKGLAQAQKIDTDASWYRRTSACAFFAPPETHALRQALERLLPHEDGCRLGDVLDIRWSVSFHRKGLRERYVTSSLPPSIFRRKFLGGGAFAGNGEVVRYRITWAGSWIDYDEERLRFERNCVPDVRIFEQPKIVICQNGRTLRAAYDENGFVLKDTFLCGTTRQGESPLCRYPRAVVGLLCSRAVHFFYSHVFYGGHVSGGYLHFLRSFLVDIPLGHWTEGMAQEVDDLVRSLEVCSDDASRHVLEARVEELVSQALGLDNQERESISTWADTDYNWIRRGRVRRAKEARRTDS